MPGCEMPDVGLLSGAEGTDTELLRCFSGETLPENEWTSDRKHCCVSEFFLCVRWTPKWVEGFVSSRLSCTAELRGAGPEAELWTAPARAAGRGCGVWDAGRRAGLRGLGCRMGAVCGRCRCRDPFGQPGSRAAISFGSCRAVAGSRCKS